MSDLIIRVENLGKKYRIRHQGERPRYVALRDVLAQTLAAPFRLLRTAPSTPHSALRTPHSPPDGAPRMDTPRHEADPHSTIQPFHPSTPAGDGAASDVTIQPGNDSTPTPTPPAVRRPPPAVEDFWALRDVSFEVQRGEVLGIIGRNGAGKSTLLKILARITEPTTGRVELRGRVASLLEVGTGFHPELTGRENIYLNGAILGMTRAEIRRKFDEIVAFAEVEKFLDTPVKRYSSGMYVRLAFAVAAHLEPEILLVDEVLAVGDAEFQKKCLGKMGEVARGGRTVLFVSHNMSAVIGLCGRALLLQSGAIKLGGATDVVVAAYLQAIHDSPRSSWRLDRKPRPGDCGKRLRILGLDFNEGRRLLHGAALHFRILFEALSDLEDVAFGIGFCHMGSGRVLSIDSDIPGPRLKIQRGQRGEAVCALDRLHLEPGRYSVDVGCRSGDNFPIDYLPHCLELTVYPGPDTPSVIAMRENGYGGVRYPAQWSLFLSDPTYEIDCQQTEPLPKSSPPSRAALPEKPSALERPESVGT